MTCRRVIVCGGRDYLLTFVDQEWLRDKIVEHCGRDPRNAEIVRKK